MKNLLVGFIFVLVISTYSFAVQKKPLKEVTTDSFTKETQVSFDGAGDNHLAIAWWIPKEFWEATLSRDKSASEADRKMMLGAISGVSLLAVVQADVSDFGAFKFYSKEEIEKNMTLSYLDANNKKQKLILMKKIDPDLEIVLGIVRPILGAAMGRLGNNMHFYVIDNKSKSSPRILDPYRKGKISIQLAQKNDKTLMAAHIETPIDALFVPRKCSNGKDAHVSWKYCPWTGEELKD